MAGILQKKTSGERIGKGYFIEQRISNFNMTSHS